MPASCRRDTVERNASMRIVGGVARLRREEAERVVAPVIAQAALDQVAVVDEGVDRQQLDAVTPSRADARSSPGAASPRKVPRSPAARPRAAASGPSRAPRR